MTDKIDKIYLLNLEKRKDRLEHFIKECDREKIDTEKLNIFKALDAETYNFTEEEKNLFHKDMDFKSYTWKGCVCNQLGHYYMIKDIVDKGYDLCLIFQDDSKLKKGFLKELDLVINNIPDDAEVIWIGLHKVAVLSYFEDFPIDGEYDKFYIKEKINEYISIYKNDINPATLAYIITKHGANQYLKYINENKIEKVTDENFNKYLIDKNKMYGSNVILVTGNSKFKSDIFKYDNNALEREMMELLEI